MNRMSRRLAVPLLLVLPFAAYGLRSLSAAPKPAAPLAAAPAAESKGDASAATAAIAAFATVQKVLQHPRCQNCHIPGDAPLQFDPGLVHAQSVRRGPKGTGAVGLQCATCHGEANPPASYGPHAPPGAPKWGLPGPQHKMVFIGVSGAQLCQTLKNKGENGGRDFAKLIEHVDHDKLVLWGWNPGGQRAPVSVPHDQFVAAFKTWAAAGGPCP